MTRMIVHITSSAVAVATTLTLVATRPAAADWPMYGHDLANSRSAGAAGPAVEISVEMENGSPEAARAQTRRITGEPEGRARSEVASVARRQTTAGINPSFDGHA